jgi:hypothetical protein
MAIPFAHKYDYPSNEIRGELADSLRGGEARNRNNFSPGVV